MAAKTYTVMNGAAVTNAAAVAISTGTAIKTHIQLQPSANTAIRLVEWWFEFDGSAAATPIKCEVLGHSAGPQTTLTSYTNADIAPANDPNAANWDGTLASNASGFGTGATEVAPSGTVRNLSTHFVPPTSGVYIQYPLGREPEIKVALYARTRTTAGAAVNCYNGLTFEC